jgi:hypothetical protein
MHCHPPAAGADIHTAHGKVLGRQTLGDKIGDLARRLFTGFEQADDGRLGA